MYSLHTKREKAHQDCIWTCDWGVLGGTVAQPATGKDGDELPAADALVEQDVEPQDLIVTGGLDDIVRKSRNSRNSI